MIKIPVIYSGKGELPTYATAASAGMDLRAAIEESISLAPMERKIIPTGMSIALPEGHEAQVRPRTVMPCLTARPLLGTCRDLGEFR